MLTIITSENLLCCKGTCDGEMIAFNELVLIMKTYTVTITVENIMLFVL